MVACNGRCIRNFILSFATGINFLKGWVLVLNGRGGKTDGWQDDHG